MASGDVCPKISHLARRGQHVFTNACEETMGGVAPVSKLSEPAGDVFLKVCGKRGTVAETRGRPRTHVRVVRGDLRVETMFGREKW